jgi:hypothetical protein
LGPTLHDHADLADVGAKLQAMGDGMAEDEFERFFE